MVRLLGRLKCPVCLLLPLVLLTRPFNLLVRSGQLVHDTVQVLTDMDVKFPDMEKVATGKIAKTDQEKEQLRVITWCPLLGNLGKGLPKKKRSLYLITGRQSPRRRLIGRGVQGPRTGAWDT